MTVARALALTALAADAPVPGPCGVAAATPAARIAGAMADPSSVPGWVADWLGGLDRAGRAAVASDAVRWMTDALALVRRRGEPEWRHPDALRHAPPGRGVTLTVAVDAVRRTGAAHLLVVRLRPSPADDRLARRLALLWALAAGEEPASVVLGFREPLELARHVVDRDARRARGRRGRRGRLLGRAAVVGPGHPRPRLPPLRAAGRLRPRRGPRAPERRRAVSSQAGGEGEPTT